MPDCCDPRGYCRMFSEREARRAVRSFERRGLDSTADPMVSSLAGIGLAGASVLEVGAGACTAIVSLLESGADRAVGYDISPEYEPVAAALLERRGLEERVDLHFGDFVVEQEAVEGADIVFLNRVVCCYPDMPRLVDAAGGKAKHSIAMSFPRNLVVTRLGERMVNAFLRLRRSSFRVFAHDPAEIDRRVRGQGFTEVASGRTLLWEWHVWKRLQA